MKSLTTYIQEALQSVSKPDKAQVEKISIEKLGNAIKEVGGNDASLIYTYKKGFTYKSFKVTAAGKAYKLVYTNDVWKWSEMKDLMPIFNTGTMRNIGLQFYGVSKKDVPADDATNPDMVDEELTNKLTEKLGANSLNISTNHFNEILTALTKL